MEELVRQLEVLGQKHFQMTVGKVGDYQAAEDILMEVEEAILAKSENVVRETLSGYFYRTLLNAINEYRRNRYRPSNVLGRAISLDTPTGWQVDLVLESEEKKGGSDSFLDRMAVAWGISAEDEVIGKMWTDTLSGIIDCSLSEVLRRTVEMFVWAGLSVDEIAQIEQIKPKSVRKRLARARKIIQAEAEELGWLR